MFKTAYMFLFVLVIAALAADYQLNSFIPGKNPTAIDENSVSGTIISRITTNGSSFGSFSGASFTVDSRDTGNVAIVDSLVQTTDNAGMLIGRKDLYVVSKRIFDYENGDSSIPVRATIVSNGTTVSIDTFFTVNPKNDNLLHYPSAWKKIELSTDANGSVRVHLPDLGAVSDADLPTDANGWRVAITQTPLFGTIQFDSLENHTIQITPHSDFWKTERDTILFTLIDYATNDSTKLRPEIDFQLIVMVNQSFPVAEQDTIHVAQGEKTSTLKNHSSFRSLIRDNDPIDTLFFLPQDTVISSGRFVVNSHGDFTFTHNNSRKFYDTVSVECSDGAGHRTRFTVPIIVTPTTVEPLKFELKPLNEATVVKESQQFPLDQILKGVQRTGTACDIVLNRPLDLGDLQFTAQLLDQVGNAVAFATYPSGNCSENFSLSRSNSGERLRLIWSGANLNERITSGVVALYVEIHDTYTGDTNSARSFWCSFSDQ